MSDRLKHMAENLRKALVSKGYSQVELAEATGLNRATVSNYFTGRQEPFQEAFLKIAERLEREPEFLIAEQEQHPANPDAFLTPLEEKILKTVDDAINRLSSPTIPIPANASPAEVAFLTEIMALICTLSLENKQKALVIVQAMKNSFDELTAERKSAAKKA